MPASFYNRLDTELEQIREQGLYKKERIIRSIQAAEIESEGKKVINLCANNYLGLAGDPRLVDEAQKALETYGFGMASVRFICGTQTIHKELEDALSSFLSQEDTILYSSCFDANAGLFETLLSEQDAIVSDSLNHASIIDGIRLCKAKRLRYANNDMADLEEKLKEARSHQVRDIMIATDGVFSMDGSIAKLDKICELADNYDALVMVDDSHAVGFIGAKGRGTAELFGVEKRVDIITGTLGKALGGASGGYTSAKAPIVELLRQRSRPYLFSNTLAPSIAATSLAVLKLLSSSDDLREKLKYNAKFFRENLSTLGFDLLPGEHPIIPVMLGDAKLASQMADALMQEGVYVIGFSFPVVPKGQARIRTQMSAAHSQEDLQRAVAAFEKVGTNLGII